MHDKLNTSDHLDHQQWLLNHGFINDLHKDNLFLYGSLVHRDVKGVELQIDVVNSKVNYIIYLPSRVLKLVALYNRLKQTDSIFSLWRLKRLIKREGNLNFEHILNRFVRDYCGAKWSASLELKDFDEYDEGFSQKTDDDGVTVKSDVPDIVHSG